MAVTYSKPIRLDEFMWQLDWTTDQAVPATFRVCREGVVLATLVSQTTAGSWRFTIMPGEYPFIEVLDKACQNPSLAFPGKLTLQWYAVSAAASYRVEQNIASVWTLLTSVPEDGRGYYEWQSGWLADCASHQFRIVPVSASGNQGTALNLASLLARHPDNPNYTTTYSAGTKKLTFTGVAA